jgi:flagellar motor switch protein FliM
MADQILSQEEIDALLTAMDQGEVDLEDDKSKVKEAVLYDLTSQSVMLRDQYNALEQVYDKFSNLLHSTLSTFFQRSFGVELATTEMVRFGEFLQAFANPTSFSMFTMEPLIGSSMMVMEPNLVFSLIDCMFGGQGKTLANIREFTIIEQRMIRKFTQEVLASLQGAWQEILPVHTKFRKLETKPDFVHLVPPNSLVLNVVFTISGETFSGNLHLCIPCLMLEPIKEQLSSRYLRDKDMEHTWDKQLQYLCKDIRVNVVAELGRTVYTVKQLLDLNKDDVLMLNSGPQDLLNITIEDVSKYNGVPGVLKGSRAIQIVSVIDQDRGANNHDKNSQ